jgi:integrase
VAKYDYVVKTKQVDGVRYKAYGKTEREAQRKLDDILFEVRQNGQKLDGNTTVKKWSKEWLEVYVDTRDITGKSAGMYHEKLKKYILPAIGSMKLKDVRDTHLKKVLNKANTSKSTAQKVKITMQAMFKQARKSRLIPYDPAEDLELPKAPVGQRHSITEYERKNILDVAEWHRGGLYVLLMLYCGLRPGECIALQWKDIDLTNGVIHVTKDLESGSTDNIKEPKSAAGIRDVPIPEKLLPRLNKPKGGDFQYVLLQPKGRKRHTEGSLRCLWNNFKRELDIHMGAEVYRNQIVKHCYEKHPLKETEDCWNALVPYSLRHTYGTDLQRAGVPINVTKYLMGHSDISVTSNYYIDTTPDVLDSAVKALDKLHCTKKCDNEENGVAASVVAQ